MSSILCVGPAEHVRSAADRLDDAGLDATVVEDGETARRRAADDGVACLVTALDLPEGSGLELGASVGVPAVLCVADGDERVAGRALAGGADGYVPAADLEDTLVPQVRAVVPASLDGRDSSPGSDAEPGSADDAGSTASRGAVRTNGAHDAHPTDAGSAAGSVRAGGDGAGDASDDSRGLDEDAVPDVEWRRLLDAVDEPPGTGAVSEAAVAEFLDVDAAPLGTSGTASDGRIPAQVRRAQTVEALHWVTNDVFGGGPTAEIADRVATAARRVLGVDLAAVYLAEGSDGGGKPVAVRGADANDLPAAEDSSTNGASDRDGDVRSADRARDVAVDRRERDSAGDDRARDRDERPGHDERLGHGERPDHGGRLAVPDAGAFPVPTVAAFPVGDRGLLCVGFEDDSRIDGWTGKLAGLLGAAADAALERERRSRRLRRAEAVVDAVDDGVFAVDGDDRVAAVDDTLVVVTGYRRDDVVGAPLSAILADGTVDNAREILSSLREEAAVTRRTIRAGVCTSHGEPIPCELTFSTVADGERVECVVRDVSDRERTADRLDACERKVEQLHATALALESSVEADAARSTAVDAAAELLDADGAWIVERVDGRYRPLVARGNSGLDGDDSGSDGSNSGPDDGDEVRRVARRVADPALEAGRTEVEGHLGTIAADAVGGHSRDDYRSGIAVPVDESTVLQVASRAPAAFDDVEVELAEVLVAHVAATLERLDYEADLQRERDRIAALFDNVPNPVVRTRIENDRAVVEAVNPSFERVFGFDTEDIVGEVIDDHIVPTDRVERAQELTRRGLEGEIVETEVRRLTATGTRDFLLTVVPIAADDGPEVNYAVYTDITERKQRQQRLEVLNRVLRHDLRNGMNVVRGSAELLAEEVDEPARDHVSAIERRAAEMIDLADRTRTIQRTLQSDPGDVGPVDVVDAVEQAIDRLDVEAEDADIATELPYRAKARVGTLLPLAIRHVLDNAVDHHDGSPTVEVAVSELDGDRIVEVEVADDGPGIPEDERMLVTEQREITQLRHGSGLGLWIVNWVVTGCGGDLEIEPREPRGTVVRMQLPQAAADRCNLPVLLD